MSRLTLGPVPVSTEYELEQLTQRMGIEIQTCEPGRVTGTMPVAGNRQPIGILHGGANAVLAETLGSLAALVYAGPGGSAVGLDLSCTHHRWVSSGTLTGECRPLYERESVASYQIDITDDSGQRTCTALLTCVIRRGTARHRAGRSQDAPRQTENR